MSTWGSRLITMCAMLVLAAVAPAAKGGWHLPGQGASHLSAPQRVDFDRQIEPIIKEHCLECHSQDKRKGGLSLATYADALDGGRNGPAIRPGNAARSIVIHRLTGAVEPQMPKDKDPLTPRQIALVRQWIDQGARRTPTSPPAPQPWEAPLALTKPAVPRGDLADLGCAARSVGREIPRGAADARSRRSCRMRCSRGACISTSGDCCRPRSSSQQFLDDSAPDKRAALVATLLADDQKYAEHWMSFWNDLLRNEDGVTYFSETAGRKSITDWLFASLENNLPYDQFVTRLLNPKERRRSGRVPCRRELARRDERRGDAMDAGVAEHRAGVSRHQPEVQRVPRQLRQQVEAEGRLLARGVLLARAEAADVSLRRRARIGMPSRHFYFPS